MKIKTNITPVAHVVNDEIVVVGTMQSLFPRTSFTTYISEEQAKTFGCFPVEKKDVGENQVDVKTEPYLQDGVVYENQVRNTTLAERKAVKTRNLRTEARRVRNAGFVINGVTFQTDREGQQDLSQLADILGRKGGTQEFVTRSGHVVNADYNTALAVRDAVEDYVLATYAHEAKLQKVIDGAKTMTALKNIDVTVGWPS